MSKHKERHPVCQFSLKDTQTTLLKPRFSSMLSRKNKFQSKICIFTPKVCLKLAPAKVSPNLGKKIVKTTVSAKKRACDALRRPATSCDVFCDACDVFCDVLRRFLRRPAASCDAPATFFWRFLADFVIFGHVLPTFWKIRVNVPKFQVSCLVSPSFDENLDKEVMAKIVLLHGLAESN